MKNKKGSIVLTMVIMIFITTVAASICYGVGFKLKTSRNIINEKNKVFNLEKSAYEKINNYIINNLDSDIEILENNKYSFNLENDRYKITVVFNLSYEIFEWRIVII